MPRRKVQDVDPALETPIEKRRRLVRESYRRAYAKDPEKLRKRAREWHAAHPEKCKKIITKWRQEHPTYNTDLWRKTRDEREAKGICTCCGKKPRTKTLCCDECREEVGRRNLEINRRLRKAALALYGDKCVCCGETEDRFLSFDHINNDGAHQRKSRKHGTSSVLHRYLLKNHPTDIQILCHNCNCAKGYYGICPHEEKRQCQQLQTPETSPERSGTTEYLQ